MFTGKFILSLLRLEKVFALYNPIHHSPLAHQIEMYPQLLSQSFSGIVLFCLGFPDRALAQSSTAITEALRLAHPPSAVSSLTYCVTMLSLTEDDVTLKERGGQLRTVATEQDFPYWSAVGGIYRG